MTATNDAVVSVDRTWRLTYLNPKAEARYGVSEALLGRNLWEAFPDAAAPGSPFQEHYDQAMHEGLSGHFEAHYGNPPDCILEIEVYPSPEGIITFSRDITELTNAAAAVLQNENSLPWVVWPLP